MIISIRLNLRGILSYLSLPSFAYGWSGPSTFASECILERLVTHTLRTRCLCRKKASLVDNVCIVYDENDVDNEAEMLDAALCITQARTQRTHANEQIRLATEDKNLYFCHLNFAITFDFLQTLQLPRFGK